jgi:hypothetical protein
VIRVFLATHKDRVSNFEIAELRGFPVFPELRARAELDGYYAPVLPGYLDGLFVNCGKLPENSRTPFASASRGLRRALCSAVILRGQRFLRRLRRYLHNCEK